MRNHLSAPTLRCMRSPRCTLRSELPLKSACAQEKGPGLRRWLLGALAAGLVLACQTGQAPWAWAQEGAGLQERLQAGERAAEEALAAPSEQPAAPPQAEPVELPPMNFLELWLQGGPLMIPITLISFLVGVFAIERWLGLRRRRVIPPALVQGLAQLSSRPGGLEPRQAYRLCQQHPSAASSVIRAMLLKVGRPHSEVERAVTEASEREAARLYKNVRPINLATTVAPLLGLLGTVQGMIECFYRTANLPPNFNKTQALANGIYVALVTTFAGLLVAIPSSVIAHYFEGRIQALFRELDEVLLGLLPQLEKYEGKLRLHRQGAVDAGDADGQASQPAAPVPAAKKD